MRRITLFSGALVAGLLMATVATRAHHSFAMFEMEKNVEYSGVVTDWKWQNPHVHFVVLIKPGAGVDAQTVGTWDVEGGIHQHHDPAGLDTRQLQGW